MWRVIYTSQKGPILRTRLEILVEEFEEAYRQLAPGFANMYVFMLALALDDRSSFEVIADKRETLEALPASFEFEPFLKGEIQPHEIEIVD